MVANVALFFITFSSGFKSRPKFKKNETRLNRSCVVLENGLYHSSLLSKRLFKKRRLTFNVERGVKEVGERKM